MRPILLGVTILALLASALAQNPPVNLFQTVRPQVLLTVRRDPNGSRADLVEVRTIDPQYPPDQLRAQLVALGTQLGSEPRGLLVARSSITGADASMTTIKGSCAIDNLIDRQTGKFHLTEIARAFAGYPAPHEVTGISVLFMGERPSKQTILSYGTPEGPVQVQGTLEPTFGGVEYRMKLNTQKAEDLVIPEGIEQKAAATPSSDASTGVHWTTWGLIAISAIAVGALVYSLLVRSGSSKRASS